MTIISKPWGHEEILEQNDKYVVKRLYMNKGHKCSLQLHEYKTETIYVLNGNMELIYDDTTIYLKENEYITIKPFVRHRMAAPDTNIIYIECSTTELNDVVRIEDYYERS